MHRQVLVAVADLRTSRALLGTDFDFLALVLLLTSVVDGLLLLRSGLLLFGRVLHLFILRLH